MKQLWDVGLEEYANDMWNVIDFVTNSLYVATVALRAVAYNQVRHKHCTALSKSSHKVLKVIKIIKCSHGETFIVCLPCIFI